MNSDSESFLQIAQEAALTAGSSLRKQSGRNLGIESSGGRDLKTRADREAEASILSLLRSRSRFSILSEEAGGEFDPRSEQYAWIVDPLDGTLNLSRGIPLCSVSVALWRGMRPVLGVVYDFFREEVFAGVVGSGATCNGRPISVSNTQTLTQGVICTGFPAGGSFEEASLAEFTEKIRAWKKVRLLGSAALSLAWVACGRADAYKERGIRFWDVAAGLALVSAAGGSMDVKKPDSLHRTDVVASNGRVSPLPSLR